MAVLTVEERVEVILHAMVGGWFDLKLGVRPFSNDELVRLSQRMAEMMREQGLLAEPIEEQS